MDAQERVYDPEETDRASHEGKQAGMWTAMPGIIVSFDPGAQTCVVQPAIRGRQKLADGSIISVDMPLLLDCPVAWQGGGGVTLTFPIMPDDECVVVFASRCIDAWWQLGGVQEQAEVRMHDLSDGYVLCGVRSQPRVFDVNMDAAQLRTDDYAAFIEINPTTYLIRANTIGDIEAHAGGNILAHADGKITAEAGTKIIATAGTDIEATAAGKIKMTAPTIELHGNMKFYGNVDQIGGYSKHDGVNVGKDHVSTLVTVGTSNSGPPA